MEPTPAQLLADLARAFPRHTITAENFAVYLRELDDIPADVMQRATRTLIRTSDFFPSISQIRAAAAECMLGLPNDNDALAQIDARIEWARDRLPDVPPPEVHPLVRSALERVGGFSAFRTTERPGILRRDFLALYNELRTVGIRDVQVGGIALEAGAQKAELSS